MVGCPPPHDFELMVCGNMIKTPPITISDIHNANNIFGPGIGCLLGKTVRHTTEMVVSNYIVIPPTILYQTATWTSHLTWCLSTRYLSLSPWDSWWNSQLLKTYQIAGHQHFLKGYSQLLDYIINKNTVFLLCLRTINLRSYRMSLTGFKSLLTPHHPSSNFQKPNEKYVSSRNVSRKYWTPFHTNAYHPVWSHKWYLMP